MPPQKPALGWMVVKLVVELTPKAVKTESRWPEQLF